ncbi:MAG: hypothetical protein HON70_35545, partial [Lentisphaerae bacterium]|nr:hypothetical protein [Lentisphaerota bacterium]
MPADLRIPPRPFLHAFLGAVIALFAAASVLAEPVALLPNQDFEAPELGWLTWPGDSRTKVEIDTSVSASGEQSLRLTAVSAADRMFPNVGSSAWKAGTIYRLTMSIRKNESVDWGAISAHINTRCDGEEKKSGRAYPSMVTRTPSGEWTTWVGYFDLPEWLETGQFCLGLEFAVGRVWFDGLIFEEVAPDAIEADVWTSVTLGVEIGAPPLQRFCRHQADEDATYMSARRYNALLMRSAFVEESLRDLDRSLAYTGDSLPAQVVDAFAGCERALNDAQGTFRKLLLRGAEAKWEEFPTVAGVLDAKLTQCDELTERVWKRIPGANTAALQAPLGAQPRTLKPLNADGTMNRLLFGAWSPTQFSEFEAPFEFEFHSSAPGTPKKHTPSEIDLTNVTDACDRLSSMGYAGTFGYLPFGIHDSLYAPDWLLKKHANDTDFLKTAWDGETAAPGKGRNHRLNFLHPAVRDHIRSYLGAYASFCSREPRVLFHETSQEATPTFRTASGKVRETGYGPAGEKAFRGWLQTKYGTMAQLNEAWSTNYESVTAITPPPDCYSGERGGPSPLVAEFEAFRDDAYIGYLGLLYSSLKTADPNKPVAARHSSLLKRISGARVFETCDVLCFHHRTPHMQLLNVYLNSLNRFHRKGLGYLEDFWGTQEEASRVADERAQRRGLEKHVSRTCIWGRTLQMKWYGYTTGGYLFTYNGNWFDPRNDLLLMRYCAPALAVAKRRMERFDWVLTHSRIVPSRVVVVEPTIAARIARPAADAYGAMLALHKQLYGRGILYEIVPDTYFTTGQAKPEDYDVIILPYATCLEQGSQRAFAKAVSNGATLVCVSPAGLRDDLALESGLLNDTLAKQMAPNEATAFRNTVAAESPPASSGEFTSGKGTVVTIADTGTLSTEANGTRLAELVLKQATPVARADPGKLEVVLRKTNAEEQFLFVLNPNVDEATEASILVSVPIARVVDVTSHRLAQVPTTVGKDLAS